MLYPQGYKYRPTPPGEKPSLDPESYKARSPNSYFHQDLGLAIKRRLVLHRSKFCIRDREIE
jgi:hypothetical protein